MYCLLTIIKSLFVYIIIINEYCVLSQKHGPFDIKINKCCERQEILIDLKCTHINDTNYGKSKTNYNLIN